MKFCAHLQVGKMNFVNENLDANPHFAFIFQIFNFSFCHSDKTHMNIFIKVFSETTLFRIMKSLTILSIL